MNIDIDSLRDDLEEYYGTALSYYPQAIIEYTKVQNASDEELISIAERNNIDLSNYDSGPTLYHRF